jgi:ribonuclease HI
MVSQRSRNFSSCTSLAGVVIRYAARLIFANNEYSTNNTTEYEALLLALRKMKALVQQTFIIRTDSKVIQEILKKKVKQGILF